MPQPQLTYRLITALLVVGCLALPWAAPAQVGPKEKLAAGEAPSSALLQAFETGLGHLQENLKVWKTREGTEAEKLARTQAELDRLQVAVASLKATLALQKLPLLRVQELLAEYADREKKATGKLQELSQEIEALGKDRQAHLEGQNSLRVQFNIIQAKDPEAVSPKLQRALLNYLALAGRRDSLTAQGLEHLEQRRRLLEQEIELLAGLAPQLKQLEEGWKAELLTRPTEAVSIWQQVTRVWESLATVPARGGEWLTDLVQSGRLGDFIWRHLAPIIGLFGFLILLGWSTRRLNEVVSQRFHAWKEHQRASRLFPLGVLGRTLIANLFGLGLIFWLGLFFWTFDLLRTDPGQVILAGLATFWTLRLGLQVIQSFFAGREQGGVLDLEPEVARFYRGSLKLFLGYLCLGFFGLEFAARLDFPQSSRLFLNQIFLMGVLVWGWWLLRRRYLTRLLPELTDPSWLHRSWVGRFFRGLMVSLLAIIILADLLGFRNLSQYLAQAAVWSLLAVVLLWFLWLMGEAVLHHLLHPEAGRASCRFPEKTDLIQRIYCLSRWVLFLILAGAVILWFLFLWGITPPQVAWAFRWMTWGPSLGPVKLTILSVTGLILALYLGFFLSRLARGLMMMRIFPRTALDTGVQYTISATVHYVILILAGLIALTLVGFPLTNLVLIFGALGVGVGFGLQNIVNNFLSGLILLFERPIKVGDMLVIDGQWGVVREIRVRSTIFETFERCVLIIPNSELVSNKVLNWTHYGPGINRLTLKVGVSYGSDVGQVTKVVTEVCRANPRVVPEPPPQIYFSAYGDSSLDFTIWVHLRTPSDRIPATHELNSAIFEAFTEHGIEMPFPQRDLHIKEWPEALEKKKEGGTDRPPGQGG